jgi:hypothetical protein
MAYFLCFIDDLKKRADLVRRQLAFAHLTRALLASGLIAFFFIAGLAQAEPKAELIDEFERTPCDDFRARLDLFSIHLKAQPTSKGYVVVFGEANDMHRNVLYEGMIEGYFRQWKIDLNRIRFVHSGFKEKLTFQFWVVPLGAEPPPFSVVEWSFKVSETEKAYLFTWEQNYDDICPEVDGVKLFVQFLRANPNSHGNIVIRNKTYKEIRRKTRVVLAELTQKFRIPRIQLRIFTVRETPHGPNPTVEYWLVP